MIDKSVKADFDVNSVATRKDRYVYEHFSEQTKPNLVLLARQLHARSYMGEGFVYNEAVDDDGTMANDIDKARGDSVKYYIGYEPKDDEHVPVSTLRKISLQGGETIEDLPGYQLSKNELYEEERDWLASIAPRRIQEISSFGHIPESPSTSGLELLRTVLQDSIGSDEIWFFTMVSEKYNTLVNLFGPEAVRKIGESISIDDPRVADVTLIPAIVVPSIFFQQVHDAVLDESVPAKRRRRIGVLTNFTEGLTEAQMGSDVYQLTRCSNETVDTKKDDFNIGEYIRKQPGYNVSSEWQSPTAFDLNIDADKLALKELLDGGNVHSIHDTFEASELFEYQHPLEQNNAQLQKEFSDDIKARREKIGAWFHYPWSRSLVHLPNKSDYQSLRTLRNRNIITNEEQSVLLSARPLIAGMSVGSNVVEQLIHSGIGGSYTLADFDTLSLSNLNRIHAGVSQVSEDKIDIIAKKISELDPYINQIHMRQGVTRNSLEALPELPSIIFDEVDDLCVKALLREYAQKNRIPLVMATDVGETSIIDIERHDIENVRPFNSRLSRETIEWMLSGKLTDADKKKITAKLIGLGNASIRLLSSIVDETVTGTPQLGPTASIGGGLAAIVTRDILLGLKVNSGRKVLKARKQLNLSSQSTVQESLSTIQEYFSKR